MKRLVLALLLAASTAQMAHAQCDGTITTYLDMKGEAMYKASTGDIWVKLYRQLADEETSCTAGIDTDLYACTASSTQMYLWLSFHDPEATSFTPGPLFEGWAPPSICICSLDWKARFDPDESLVTLLRNWADGTAASITFYVGRITGGGAPSTQDFCEECLTSENYFATFDVVGVPNSGTGHQPIWYTALHTVTSPPSGCRPSCDLDKSTTSETWGLVKHRYEKP
jgi:hypothetical protein